MKRPAPGEDVHKVAHDFNNLLTAIIGAADAIIERPEIDPETRADIAHIREGARRGTMLVQRLRGTTQDATDPPGLISVNQTIRATYRLLDHKLGPNIALALDLPEPGEQVRIDPSQLDRAMLNLIANARHAMPDGGTVTLGTSRRVVAVAESRVPDTIPPGIYVVIAVADGGAGIPHKQISRIFEIGFSSRHQAGGSGLGLSSTRDIVRRSNGFLSVKSVEGRGTSFEIYLPLGGDACAPVAPSAAEAPVVLLVEDDLFVRRVAERTLHRAGWNVLRAGSAEEALDVLHEAKCDLLISDITLPCMDGVALARLMLVRHPGMPVILTSGYARTAVSNPETVANVVFLTKPYAQAELLDLIAEIVARKAAGS
jgi:two-component system cell cycle sensor histidine kinase/response regulator CckA